jgi:hypothetical protein
MRWIEGESEREREQKRVGGGVGERRLKDWLID